MNEMVQAGFVLGVTGMVGAMMFWLLMRLWAWRAGLGGGERAVPRVQTFATITPEELDQRLLGAPGSPVYAALLVVVDEEIVRHHNVALQPDSAEAALRYELGGEAALVELKDELAQRIEQARQNQAEAEQQKQTANERE